MIRCDSREYELTANDLSKLSIDRAPGRDGSARRRRRWWIGAALVLGAALALWAARSLLARAEVDTAGVNLVYPAQDYTLLNATGYVVAQRKAALSSKATGRLEWLGVLEGSHVRQGELIARLENGDVSAALAQARANAGVARAGLAQAEAELVDARNGAARSSELLAQRFVAAAADDAAQARHGKARAAVAGARAAIAAANANVEAARVALDQTLIRAPFDGVILTKSANVGDNITPFSSAADSKGAVVTIADMDTLEVETDVSESNLASIRVGQAADIALDAFPELRLAGQVARMVPTLDRSKATLLVKLRFVEHDARVLPDMSAKVAFLSKPVPPEDKRARTALPPAALAQRDGRTVAFVVRDGHAYRHEVGIGRALGALVEVRGLAAGSRVVLRPSAQLADGAAVTVREP
jgi:HlyD family secretion protein